MADTILRKKRPFVGREDLRKAFHNWLITNPQEEHPILLFHGPPGIGKSALRMKLNAELREYDPEARAVLLDFERGDYGERYYEVDKTIINLRSEFHDLHRIPLPSFDIAYAMYWKKINPQVPLKEEKFPFLEEGGVIIDIAEKLMDIGSLGIIPKAIKLLDTLDKRIYESSIEHNQPILKELREMELKDVEKSLRVLFANDINEYIELYGYRVVIFLDSYDQIWRENRSEADRFKRDQWIRDIISDTPKVYWVILKREPLEWGELDNAWEEKIESREIGALGKDYALEYLIKSGVNEEEIRNVMLEGYEGVPFYLDVSLDQYFDIKEKRDPSPADFGRTPREVLDKFISNLNKDEIEILRVLSFAKFWDRSLFEAVLGQFKISYPLTQLERFHRFSFIREYSTKDTWIIHALMRKATKDHTKPEVAKDIVNFLFAHYNDRLMDIDIKNITEIHKTALSEAYYHATQSLALDELLTWFMRASDPFYKGAEWAFLTPLYLDISSVIEKALGLDHPFVATTLNNLAELYRSQGRYADAEPLYKRALEITEKAQGPDHSDVAATLNNLALLYQSQGRYAEAEPLYRRSLEIKEKALGPDDPDVSITLHNLALLYKSQGRYGEAEPLYKRSLEIKEKALGPDHPDVATTLNNLASLYESQGKQAEAEPLYKRSLEIKEKALGPDHPDVATTLNNLALLYKSQGRYAEAEPLYKRSLEIIEKALGPDHPSVATMLNNLAGLYKSQGKDGEAEPLCKRSLEITEKALGPDHADVATTLNNLAGLYESQGRYAEAEPLYKRALGILNKSFGPIHPNIATVLENMAVLYEEMGKKEEAKMCLARAKEIRSKLQ